MNKMEQFKVDTRKGVNVSETTALFVDAMREYDIAKSKFLNALTALYGESQANEMFNGIYAERLNAVDGVMFEGLGMSVRDNISVCDMTATTI